VVIVTTAQYIARGMLVKPLSLLPSIRYITVPLMMISVTIASRNTMIFERLARSAWSRTTASRLKCTSFRILNTRRRRIVRMTISEFAPGSSSAR
jgi:hypothetical protein